MLFRSWKKNGLNAICDKDDIVTMTKRINGGTIGLDDRTKHYNHAKEVLGGHVALPEVTASAPASTGAYETVRVGSKGETVKKVQAAVGLTADGSFGPGTEKAVKAWQTKNGLTADGVMGPKSLAKLLG